MVIAVHVCNSLVSYEWWQPDQYEPYSNDQQTNCTQ